MSNYLFTGKYQNQTGYVKVKLLLLSFADEKNTHFIYSPHLDITGYGIDDLEAKKSFEIVFEDFIDYTLKKKTLPKILEELGWQLKGSAKKPKKMLAPSITKVIGSNKHVSDIFDRYNVNTFHEEVGIPEFA
jgi:hypothetical protein